jgi:hypothetical protein
LHACDLDFLIQGGELPSVSVDSLSHHLSNKNPIIDSISDSFFLKAQLPTNELLQRRRLEFGMDYAV